jgi:hypothetical protein
MALHLKCRLNKKPLLCTKTPGYFFEENPEPKVPSAPKERWGGSKRAAILLA